MRMRRFWAPLALAGVVGLSPSVAEANGQSTHMWISHEAIEHLPEGPLRTMLEGHMLMVDNGTMFPDGGYPLDDPYAEIAHWEPFQGAYMQWLMDNHSYPYEGTAAEHLSFMMGMNSHGMADQVFDALYMERTIVYDGDKDELDTLSDVVMMSLVGGGFDPPEDWVPYDLFDELYSSAAGYDVDPSQMQSGQGLLRIAILAVKSGAMNPDDVAAAQAQYPWGNGHLLDDSVPGSPPCEGEVISRYWQSQWELLHGRELYRPVIATWPEDGGINHEIDSTSIESWVSLAFARGLESAEVTVDDFEIRSEEGELVPFNVNVFYGQDSHVVHLKPTENFTADTVYTVTVAPGVPHIHGGTFEGWSWTFSTGPEAPEPINPPWGEGLDGSDGSEPGGDEGAEGETGTESGEPPMDGGGDELNTTTETSEGESSAGHGDHGDEDSGGGGCASSCSVDGEGPPGAPTLALFAALLGLRRRRQKSTLGR